jgi:hypothetical protein
VFDETVLTFVKLHPNVGALLSKEIILLIEYGGVKLSGSNTANDPTTNPPNAAI